MFWKSFFFTLMTSSNIMAFHSEFFKPQIFDRRFSYVQGLTCNHNSLIIGTNSGSIVRIAKDILTGELEQKEIISIAKRNIKKIHADDDFLIARTDSDDFVERPFGESVIMGLKPLRPLFRLHHVCGDLIYDAITGPHTYLTVYSKKIRKSLWDENIIHETFYTIQNMDIDEYIHLACHTDKRLYVMTSSSRFGWLDDDQYSFHELHHIPFLGMTTSMHVKQLREDTMFVYIGTSTGMVYFLQFNGTDCIIRNQIQISSENYPIAQISSSHGNTIYAATTDCQIVGFNMISFDIVFNIKTNYDQFQCNTDNFIVKSNSIITYDNKERIVCYIL